MEASIQERVEDPEQENLTGKREEQHAHAADGTGHTAVGNEVELGSYDYFKNTYENMDWTPQDEVVL